MSLTSRKFKFCFFIDGLDEFDGKPGDIIRIIELLNKSNSLKASVSSRPWNEFEASFGKLPPCKLYLHELTEKDIQCYVEDTLGRDERFLELLANDEQCPDLVKDIVDAAHGVFL
jgi:hypothetical protein